MKKTNITRFAKTALQVSKLSKHPIVYYSKDGFHTVACAYFVISTKSEELYKSILSKIPENKRVPDSLTHNSIQTMLSQTDGLHELTNTGIVSEEQHAYRRFLMADDFVVTVNDDFLYVFDGDRTGLYGSGSNSPVIVFGYDYTAAILPLRHRSNEAALATMHRLIGRSGWQPDREEA